MILKENSPFVRYIISTKTVFYSIGPSFTMCLWLYSGHSINLFRPPVTTQLSLWGIERENWEGGISGCKWYGHLVDPQNKVMSKTESSEPPPRSKTVRMLEVHYDDIDQVPVVKLSSSRTTGTDEELGKKPWVCSSYRGYLR